MAMTFTDCPGRPSYVEQAGTQQAHLQPLWCPKFSSRPTVPWKSWHLCRTCPRSQPHLLQLPPLLQRGEAGLQRGGHRDLKDEPFWVRTAFFIVVLWPPWQISNRQAEKAVVFKSSEQKSRLG